MRVSVCVHNLFIPIMVSIFGHTVIINIVHEVMCAVCKTGHHSFCALRRRLDDDTFELLVGARDRAKVVAAMHDALADEAAAVR